MLREITYLGSETRIDTRRKKEKREAQKIQGKWKMTVRDLKEDMCYNIIE